MAEAMGRSHCRALGADPIHPNPGWVAPPGCQRLAGPAGQPVHPKAISQMEADPETSTVLPQLDRQILGKHHHRGHPENRLAQVACARHLGVLHTADRDWAAKFILPLLDPSNEERAVRCWDAYLMSRQWTPATPP